MTPPSSLSEFEARLHEALDPVKVPSVAYGIARNHETLLVGAAGLANKERGIAATPDTAYSLASVTKPLTTTALMLLVRRGLIDLDAPINEYLGDAKLDGKAGDAREATVRRVADHSAGLPLHYQFYYADEPYPRPPMDDTIRRYGKLFTPPGERHHYSNLGYGLLDYVIERVSGRPYAEFVAEEVFRPLGMGQATIGRPDGAAVPYGPDGEGYPPYDFDHPGGSAGFASVHDMLAFGRFHLGRGPELLPPATLEEMHRRTAAFDDNRGYGLGWRSDRDRFGLCTVQHTGGMGGVATILRLVPEMGLVIAVMVNGQSPVPMRAADDAIAALLPEFRERLAQERVAATPEPERLPVPDEIAGVWRGAVETHEGERSLALEICSGTEAVVRLEGAECAVEELQMDEGHLVGVFDGDVGTPDAGRRDYRIHLDLKPRGDVLNGAAVTLTKLEEGGGGAPGKRMGNALAYWTELRRA